jgi:hypothetical protein
MIAGAANAQSIGPQAAYVKSLLGRICLVEMRLKVAKEYIARMTSLIQRSRVVHVDGCRAFPCSIIFSCIDDIAKISTASIVFRLGRQ